MRATVGFGRVGGVPVGAHWSALLGVVLLGELLALRILPALVPGHDHWVYAVAGTVAAVVFALSLLAHELAHAVVARRAGVEVRQITLWLLGGISELAEQPRRPADEVRVALVGPLVSLALGALFAGASWAGDRLGWPALGMAVLIWLGSVNLLLGAFNLLPGTPLDGGRVLHGLVWSRTRDRERATRVAGGTGQVVGAVLAGVGVLLLLQGRWDGLWLVVVGWFIGGAAVAERAHETVTARLAGLRAGDVMTPDPAVAADWWTVQALIDRLLGAQGLRHRVFPVVDFAGRAVGLLGLTDLAAVDPAARLTTTVRRVAHPLPACRVLDVDAPVAPALDRPPGPGPDALVVLREGRVVGLITATDLRRAVELRSLELGAPRA